MVKSNEVIFWSLFSADEAIADFLMPVTFVLSVIFMKHVKQPWRDSP